MSQTEASGRSRETSLTLLIFFVGFPASYCAHIFYSRALGAAAYGDFSVTISVATLVNTLALLGFNQALQKFLPIYDSPERIAYSKGFLLYGARTVAVSATVCATLGWLGTRWIEARFGVDEHPVLDAMLLVVPMTAIIFLVSLLNGLDRPVLSALFFQILVPLGFLSLGFVVSLKRPITEFLAVELMIITRVFFIAVLLLLIGRMCWGRYRGVRASFDKELWWKSTRAFAVTALGAAALRQSGLLMVEWLHPHENDVGIYTGARFTADFPLIAFNAISLLSMPRFSRWLDAGEIDTFRSQLGLYLRLLILVGVSALGAWALWGDAVLALAGSDFADGHTTLMIMAVGALFTLAFGLSKNVLQIKGETRVVFSSTLGLLALNVGLCYFLIPRFGPEGAAASYVIALLFISSFEVFWVQKKLGLPYLSTILKR